MRTEPSVLSRRQKRMRLLGLVFTTTVAVSGMAVTNAQPQQPSSSSATQSATTSSTQDAPAVTDPQPLNLPVSLDRIKKQLAKPPDTQLRGLDTRPDFRVEVQEHRKLEDLIASLDFKIGPVPAGGLLANEMQRVQFPSVQNPLRQPYAAFSQSELLTILVENLVGKYLGGRLLDSVTASERSRAENAAKAQVRDAIIEYCAAQPNRTTIQLCSTSAP